MTLPTLTLTLRETNPEYVARYNDGESRPYNMDEYQKDYEIEVEVVQLNLNSGGMRVRYQWPDKYAKKGVSTQSRDVSIEHFYKQYEIKAVG
jgi:hypothetical protein